MPEMAIAPMYCTFAKLALQAGAAGVTVHPRPDQRHITAADAIELGAFLNDQPQEFNIEGNPFEGQMGTFPGFMNLVKQIRPDQCTGARYCGSKNIGSWVGF